MSFAITRPNCDRKTGNKNYLAMCNCVTTYLTNVSNSFLLFVYQTSIEEEKIVFTNFLFQLPCALRWQNTKNCIHSFSVNFANFHSHRVCNKPFGLFCFFFPPLLPDPTVSTKGMSRLSSIPSRRSWLVKGEITWLRGKSSFRAWQGEGERQIQRLIMKMIIMMKWNKTFSFQDGGHAHLDLQRHQPHHGGTEGQRRRQVGAQVQQREAVGHAGRPDHAHHLFTTQDGKTVKATRRTDLEVRRTD